MITSISWTIQATITSTTDPNAKLVYQTTAQVVNGYANFTNLGVSSSSSQFVIQYSFVVPDGIDQ